MVSSMPTVLQSGPYRFYFYSHEPNEPPHVHVDRDDLSAKFWLQPVGLARNLGFSPKELRRLQKLVTPGAMPTALRGHASPECLSHHAHAEPWAWHPALVEAWHRHFGA